MEKTNVVDVKGTTSEPSWVAVRISRSAFNAATVTEMLGSISLIVQGSKGCCKIVWQAVGMGEGEGVGG